jgi:hypothetical protein
MDSGGMYYYYYALPAIKIKGKNSAARHEKQNVTTGIKVDGASC